MPPLGPLTTIRLTLRPVTPADRADLIALEADPMVMRYLNGGQPVPEVGLPEGDFLTPRGTEPEILAAHEISSGRFVGWFAFFDDGLINGLRTAEIGYRLARDSWGHGYATEGAKALIDLAFRLWGFDCVLAKTVSGNLGSRRVMEKAGMQIVSENRFANRNRIPGWEPVAVTYAIRKPDPYPPTS